MKRISLAPVRAFSEGRPYDECALLSVINCLCDTVANTFFKHHVRDDEMLATARCRVFELLCRGKVAFQEFTDEKCFSFLYTTARNTMGNYLKHLERNPLCIPSDLDRVPIPQSSGKRRPSPPSMEVAPVAKSSPVSQIIETDLCLEASHIRGRMEQVGMNVDEERYSSVCLRAAIFRAFEGVPA